MLPWIIWISYSPERVEGKTKLVVPDEVTVVLFYFKQIEHTTIPWSIILI